MYLYHYGDDEDGNEKKCDLFEVPGAPEDPWLQAHHQHGLTNTNFFLEDQLLHNVYNEVDTKCFENACRNLP